MEPLLVNDPSAVTAALGEIDAPVVGVDVERGDGQTYRRPVALVQVGAEGRCVLLDTLAVEDLGALDAHLRARFPVLHALENDLGPLRDAGVDIPHGRPVHEHVADTAVAAALLGLPTGLGPLLEGLLEIELPHDKSRLQRADWTIRPLEPEMIAYAAADVIHLPTLWAMLAERLEREGRLAWYQQELEATIAAERSAERSWVRTRGAGKLDGRGRAMLRELWETREEIARDEDVAPQRVVRDDALVTLADDPPATVGVLRKRGLRGRQIEAYGERILGAIRRARTAPDEPSLTGRRRASQEDRLAHDRLRKARAGVARDLGIDPGVLCPGRILLDAVLADPENPGELCEAAGLRPWQRELLAEVLWEAYEQR